MLVRYKYLNEIFVQDLFCVSRFGRKYRILVGIVYTTFVNVSSSIIYVLECIP